jgi:MarR family transcriptional regulator for hemolysin
MVTIFRKGFGHLMFNEFFHLYLQLSRGYTKKLNEQLAHLNIHHAQWSIIYYLHQRRSATLVEISQYLKVEKPTITRTVNRLEERDLIKQIATKDKRERRIQLSDKGLHIYKECHDIVNQFEQRIMSNLSEQEVEDTKQILQQIKENIRGD